ncbi:hypothetical protein MBLNU13_g02602t1 [Cladosporium sp. NU13]
MTDENDNANDLIRCPCGSKDDLPQSQKGKGIEAWIGCEACLVWQHSICVGLGEEVSSMPDKYYCEQCKPDHHKRFRFGSQPDNRQRIAKERQEITAMPRARDQDEIKKKMEWLVSEIEAIMQEHPQAVTVEWAKLNGMQADFEHAVKAHKAGDPLPTAHWTFGDFEFMVRIGIRVVLRNASVSAVERFKTRLIKVRFDEAEAVATELWSLRSWLNVEIMNKIQEESLKLGQSKSETVRRFFNMK